MNEKSNHTTKHSNNNKSRKKKLKEKSCIVVDSKRKSDGAKYSATHQSVISSSLSLSRARACQFHGEDERLVLVENGRKSERQSRFSCGCGSAREIQVKICLSLSLSYSPSRELQVGNFSSKQVSNGLKGFVQTFDWRASKQPLRDSTLVASLSLSLYPGIVFRLKRACYENRSDELPNHVHRLLDHA